MNNTTITPNPTDLPRQINGRILVKAHCFGGCGRRLEQWIKPGGMIICHECRDAADRKANGWTPANSVD